MLVLFLVVVSVVVFLAVSVVVFLAVSVVVVFWLDSPRCPVVGFHLRPLTPPLPNPTMEWTCHAATSSCCSHIFGTGINR